MHKVKAKKLSRMFVMSQSFYMQELSLIEYIFCLEKNPLLFLLPIESSSGSIEARVICHSF